MRVAFAVCFGHIEESASVCAPDGPVRGWAAATITLRWTALSREAAVEARPDLHERGDADAVDLVDALRAGDEAAFLALVQRHHAAMVRVALAYVSSTSVAEEVAQEAWIGVLQGIRLFEGRSSLKTWIFRILVNCAKTRGASEGRSVPISALAELSDEAGRTVPQERFIGDGERWAGHWSDPPEPWPDARVESSEMVAIVRDGIEMLPDAQRTVMTLRDVDGWSSGEVCELLAISEGNQRVLLHRARSKVRAFAEERLGTRGKS